MNRSKRDMSSELARARAWMQIRGQDPGTDPEKSPMPQFVIHELSGAIACFIIFVVSHILAYLTQLLAEQWAVRDDGPLIFTSTCLSWVGSIGVVAAFTIITVYQLLGLVLRLARTSRGR